MKAIDRIFDNLYKKTQENKILKQENRKLKLQVKIKNTRIRNLEQENKILKSEVKRLQDL